MKPSTPPTRQRRKQTRPQELLDAALKLFVEKGFAATRAERIAKNDPRPSLEERYGDHAGYVKKFTEATEQLVAARLLLREDADLLIARAKSAETARRFAPDSK